MTEADLIASRISTVTIRGRRYRFQVARLKNPDDFGGCDPPDFPGKRIVVAHQLHGLPLLDTIIHEGLHACCWDLHEDTVDEGATSIARMLWRAGYRLTP